MARAIWLAGLLALALSACVETRSPHMNGNGAGANPPDSMDRVLSRTFTVPAFKLESGQVLPEGLGVQHLVAVAGPSYGGYQTFQWAVTSPTFMSGVVPVVSAPKGSGGDASVKALRDRFATDPNWNGGWYYDRGGIFPTLLQLR